MDMKLGHVRNPLSVIALFAAFTEGAGIGVLPLIDKEVQAVYIWFLMLFPIALVGCFFATIWFAHTKLYAPSDFKDEDNFVKASKAQVEAKLQSEISFSGGTSNLQRAASDGALTVEHDPTAAAPALSDESLIASPATDEGAALSSLVIMQRAKLAEKNALDALAAELGVEFDRNVSPRHRRDLIFDAVHASDHALILAEVKYVRNTVWAGLGSALSSIIEGGKTAAGHDDRLKIVGYLLVVHDGLPPADLQSLAAKIQPALANSSVPIYLRFMDFETLINSP